MPSIRNNEAQQKALKKVSKALGELKISLHTLHR